MAYSAKVGSFNIDTTKTDGQTQAITGVGFQPKVVLIWYGGSTGTGDSVSGGDIVCGFGAAVSSSSRWSVYNISTDAAGTSNTAQNKTQAAILLALNADAAAYTGRLDFVSMDVDGFTVIYDTAFSSNYRVSYLALGGTDLTNVYLGEKAMPTVTGNYSVTGVGFQPDALITCGIVTTSDGETGGGNACFGLGFATGASNQGTIHGFSQDNVDTSNTVGYGYNGEINAIGNNGTTRYRDAFVSFDTDGFTLNHLEGTSAIRYFYVALKGGQYTVGEMTTATDGSDISETFDFHPVAVLFASANRALSTQDTATDHMRLSIGAGTSTSNRACMAVSDEDNLGTTETAYANYDSAVYAHVIDDAIEALMDIKSIDSTGFTCVMDDTETSARWVTYLAIGAAGGAVSSISSVFGSDHGILFGGLTVR